MDPEQLTKQIVNSVLTQYAREGYVLAHRGRGKGIYRPKATAPATAPALAPASEVPVTGEPLTAKDRYIASHKARGQNQQRR